MSGADIGKKARKGEIAEGVISLRKEPDIEVEKLLLGTLLNYSGENFPDVLDEGLRPEDFYRATHGVIFDAMAGLYNENEPIDVVILAEKLKNSGFLTKIGGAGYLEDLFALAITQYHTRQYAKIVVDKAAVRRLMAACGDSMRKCEEGPKCADDVLDEAEAAIFKIRDARLNSSLASARDLIPSTYDMIVGFKSLRGALSGIPTGFDDLDFLTGGFQRSDLIVLGGRPGMGKTAIPINLAWNASLPPLRQGQQTMPASSVLFFSLEMSRDQIMQRIVCQLAKLDLLRMRAGRLSDDEYELGLKKMSILQSGSLYIDDSSGRKLRPMDLRAKARSLKRKLAAGGLPPLELIVVDYLQLLTPDESQKTREREVAEISAGMKSIAKELNVAVLCCSQLRRSDDSKPDLSDLRDSGAIEQDADMVLFILRKELIHPEKPELAGKAELQIKKHRNGPTGVVDLVFLKESSAFAPARYEKIENSLALAAFRAEGDGGAEE